MSIWGAKLQKESEKRKLIKGKVKNFLRPFGSKRQSRAAAAAEVWAYSRNAHQQAVGVKHDVSH